MCNGDLSNDNKLNVVRAAPRPTPWPGTRARSPPLPPPLPASLGLSRRRARPPRPRAQLDLLRILQLYGAKMPKGSCRCCLSAPLPASRPTPRPPPPAAPPLGAHPAPLALAAPAERLAYWCARRRLRVRGLEVCSTTVLGERRVRVE